MNRKEWKTNAKKTMKQHYFMFVFWCIVLGVLGLNYVSSLSTVRTVAEGGDVLENYRNNQIRSREPRAVAVFDKVYDLVVSGNLEEGRIVADSEMAAMSQTERKLGNISIGHSRGVFAQLVNMTSTGSILVLAMDSIRSMVHSKTLAMILFVALSGLIVWLVRVYIFDVILVVVKRYFLEARWYEKMPVRRILFILRTKKWTNVALAIFLRDLYQVLWDFTIIGGVIKGYSYFMVPYIMAENPSIKPKQAINLSRRMMDGYKFDCFLLKFSFFGWMILDYLTLGLSGALFSNAYQESTMAEYYVYIREMAIENQIEDIELLNDRYLFEEEEKEVLERIYADLHSDEPHLQPEYAKENIIKKILAKGFGVQLLYDENERLFEEYTIREGKERQYSDIIEGHEYPERLSPIPEKEHRKRVERVNYLRRYSIPSLILMFFTMCFIGWFWEVVLHLVSDGEFVNRGVLHGPWLPIYGTGGMLILLVLFRFRKNPLLLFSLTLVLCGILEYFTGYYLELTHNGQKWWDYSGYFLNLHGRICAEGLLVFGLGGLAIVYIFAPILDSIYRRLPLKRAVILCVILLTVYIADQIYSKKHPNMGDGITTVKLAAQETELIERFL